MNKKLIILLCSLICIFVVFYFVFINNKKKVNNTNNNAVSSNVVEKITYEDKSVDFSKYTETNVDLDSEKEVYNITSGGVYHITGELNGYIKVDTEDDVKIMLDNVTITNDNGPCIYGVNSNNIYIEIIGENTLTDGKTYTGFEEEVTSAIFSNDDLIFSGTGSLVINANYNDGISSDDDITFENGTYTIKSVDDGIRGKDSVVITSGIFTIESNGDGIKSTNDTETDKGYILIKNGTFNITNVNDAIDASTNVEIDSGDFNIKTSNTDADSSAKGIKANNNILIKKGNIDIDSSDDAIHSNNTIEIDNGKITITSDDDGIHADSLVVINDGTININAHEGIEATYVKINGGTININASDDGINAAKKSTDYTPTVEINGGNITIKMGSGDTDGIDSNGNIYVNGGTINITGQSAFDYDGEAKNNGGTIIINGETTNTITNQMMGGKGGMNNPRNARMNGNMPNSDRMRNNDMNQTDQGMRPDMSTNGGRRNGRGRM